MLSASDKPAHHAIKLLVYSRQAAGRSLWWQSGVLGTASLYKERKAAWDLDWCRDFLPGFSCDQLTSLYLISFPGLLSDGMVFVQDFGSWKFCPNFKDYIKCNVVHMVVRQTENLFAFLENCGQKRKSLMRVAKGKNQPARMKQLLHNFCFKLWHVYQ